MRKLAVFSIVVGLVACANTGIVPVDDGAFMIGIRSAQVGFGPPEGAKADAYKAANKHCGAMNKVVETVQLQETPSGFGRPASVNLTFKCVSGS